MRPYTTRTQKLPRAIRNVNKSSCLEDLTSLERTPRLVLSMRTKDCTITTSMIVPLQISHTLSKHHQAPTATTLVKLAASDISRWKTMQKDFPITRQASGHDVEAVFQAWMSAASLRSREPFKIRQVEVGEHSRLLQQATEHQQRLRKWRQKAVRPVGRDQSRG